MPMSTPIFDEDPEFPVASPPVAIVACSTGGYWIVTNDGATYALGGAPFLGSLSGLPLSAPIISGSSTPTGRGLYLLGHDGAVYAWGDAIYAGRLLYDAPER
jgi:hypothetical protein